MKLSLHLVNMIYPGEEALAMRILKTSAALSCALLLSVVGAGAASAATIQNFDSGWYTNNGFTAGVTNINVGSSNLSGDIYRNWLAFNIAGLAAQTITSATLTFYGGNGVSTSTTSETLGLFDYTGSINALISNSQNNVGIYTDLGNGASYGTANVPGNGAIQQFTVTLSQPALVNLNAAAQNQTDSRFVIGGSLLSISGPFANEQLFAIFGSQAALAPAAFLNLETAAAVPEPSTWTMMILGVAVAGMASRRKRAARELRFA